MRVNFSIKPNQKVVAIATSGGEDSIALLHYAYSHSKNLGITVKALNVEHGIRGKDSISDTKFVLDFCKNHGIPCIAYSVDAKLKAKQDKIPLELAARLLRYDCFYDAVKNGKCDVVATAHHLKDNTESVLFNIFRGSGIKGLKGITDYPFVIRPLVATPKAEITEYVKQNGLTFVTDKTNFDTDYSRNYIRQEILPKIEKVFPSACENVYNLSKIAGEEDEFLDDLAKENMEITKGGIKVPLGIHPVLMKRASILALKALGVKKDWTKTHIDSVLNLTALENGASVDLLDGIRASREYGFIFFYKPTPDLELCVPFSVGEFEFFDKTFSVSTNRPKSLKSGLFIDKDKIPSSAVIRTKRTGDLFTKFNGGTKSLADYFTDNKIPLRVRNKIPLIASGNTVYAIFGLGVSDLAKVDDTTKTVLEIK